MSYSPQIQFSTKYDDFKFYIRNRPTSPLHVKKLVNDPSFKIKYPSCPIIVSSTYEIIDGQHRFLACKELGLPIYYIMDPLATAIDIKNRNVNQNAWTGKDFIEYYAHEDPDYALLQSLKEKHDVPYALISAAIKKIVGYGRAEYSSTLKNGELKIYKNREKLLEFLDIYIPIIRETRACKGHLITRSLFTETVITGFCDYFLTRKSQFLRAMDKLPTCRHKVPHCNTAEEAKEAISKLVHSRNEHEKKD